MATATDHGPDRSGVIRATDAAVLAGATRFQIRTSQLPTGLVATAISVSHRQRAGIAQIAPAPGAPPITPRAAWGAQAPRSTPVEGTVALAFVHHTVSPNDYASADSPAIVRAIQEYHRNTLGWNDIGYNLLVDRYGQIFEGRAGGVDRPIVGAQAQGFNSVSTGIALIGTHTLEGITPAAYEALASILGWKLTVHAVPAQGTVVVTSAGGESSRYRAGTPVTLERISGHRDGDLTECPGQALYDQLPALRLRVTAGTAPGLSLALATGRVEYKAATAASGRLGLADGTAGAGRTVQVQTLGVAGWTTLATAITDAAGNWTSTLALPYTRKVRAIAIADGDLGQPQWVSSTVRLEVRSGLRTKLAPTHLRLGQSLVLSAHIEPRKARQKLTVVLERRSRTGHYRRVAVIPATARNGKLALPSRPTGTGLYRYRIIIPGDRLNAPTRAAPLFARVKR